MAQERLTIHVDEKGALVVARNIDDIGKAAKKADGPVQMLKKALAGIAAAAAVKQLIDMADAYTVLQNKLRQVTTDSQNLAAVTAELYAISGRTRSSFAATAEGYAKVALAAKDLGLTQQEMLQFTESLNKAVVIGGSTATEAAGGLRQLSQGLASGTLRGDELISVLENLPYVADIISKQLGVTRGELRKMGADGKITARDVIAAFKAQREEIDQRFGRTIPTVSEAVQRLTDAFLRLVGEFNNSHGITQTLAGGILKLANTVDTLSQYLNTAITATVSFGAAIGAIKLLAAQQALIGTVGALGAVNVGLAAVGTTIKTLFATIAANPIGLGLLAIAASATAAVAYFDKMKSMQAEIEATEERIHQSRLQRVQAQVQEIKNRKAGNAALESYLTSLKEEVRVSTLSKEAKAIEEALLVAKTKANRDLHASEVAVIESAIRQKELRMQEKELLESILGPQKKYAEELATLKRVQPQLTAEQYADALSRLNAEYGKTDGLKTYLKDLEEETRMLQLNTRERRVQQELKRAEKEKGSTLSTDEVRTVTTRVTNLGDLEQERQLMDQLRAPRAEHAALLETINRLKAQGIVFSETEQRQLAEMLAGYPLLLADLRQETELLKLSSREREIAIGLEQLKQQLRAQGAEASPAELKEYEATLRLNQALAEHQQLKESLITPQQEYEQAVKRETLLYKAGAIDLKEYTAALTALNEMRSQQTEGSKNLDSAMRGVFRGAFQELTDFTTNGKLVFGQFVSDILAQIAQIQAQKFFTGLMTSIGLPGFASGGSFTVGGEPGVDKNIVAFKASRNETVTVTPPGRQPASETPMVQAQMPGIRIINVLDRSLVADYLNSSDGEKAVINVISSNPGAVRQAIA